jgi:hypothetical protein
MLGGQTWDELLGRQVIAAALGEIVSGAARTDTFLAKRYKRIARTPTASSTARASSSSTCAGSTTWLGVPYFPLGSAFLGVAKVTEHPGSGSVTHVAPAGSDAVEPATSSTRR